MKYNIDHIVYIVKDLYQGMDELEKKLGVKPEYGGKHQTFGTHNALIGLGDHCYLELLASDPENSAIPSPRWMGVDLVDKPLISRWAIVADDIHAYAQHLKEVNPAMGNVQAGMRKRTDGSMLRWQLAMPLPEPLVEVIPFVLNWQDSVHPSKKLTNHCELLSFSLGHPNPGSIRPLFNKLGIQAPVKKNEQPRISITLNTPNGVVIL